MKEHRGQNADDPTPRQRRRWVRRGVEGALIIALIFAVRTWQQRDLITGPAPSLHGVLLNGPVFDLRALHGQAVLVHFWATWCPICELQHRSVDALSQDYSVITVAMQSGSSTEVQAYLRAHELVFPVLNDPDGEIAAAWGIRGVPASFFLGADGGIRFVEVGYTTGIGLRARLWLAGR